MNHHLNLFRFFNESTEKEFIENNLSRAFSICLSNNGFFLSEYIKAIVSAEDYNYLFSSISEDSKYSIDIQIDTAFIDKESYSKIYAVAMTSDKDLNMDDFFSHPDFGEKKNITDIIISIKDIAIIIEVKRTGEDCKAQLLNQVLPFINGGYKVTPHKFSWQEIIKLMEKVTHVQHLISQDSVFINDFIEFSETKYPIWFEPKPFNVIPFSAHDRTVNNTQLIKRMRQAFARVSLILGDKYQLLPYNDRWGITVPFGWANEINLSYQTDKLKSLDYIVFSIYPGNTKQQGFHIFNKSLSWQNTEALNLKGIEYEVNIVYHVKLCHFNKYVSGLWFENDDALIKPFYSKENFDSYSGKWTSDTWDEFEKLMDEHFKPEFNWREKCSWTGKFINTDRSYFTLSLGYEVSVYIPYSHFKSIDKTEHDIVAVTDFIISIVKAFQSLIK